MQAHFFSHEREGRYCEGERIVQQKNLFPSSDNIATAELNVDSRVESCISTQYRCKRFQREHFFSHAHARIYPFLLQAFKCNMIRKFERKGNRSWILCVFFSESEINSKSCKFLVTYRCIWFADSLSTFLARKKVWETLGARHYSKKKLCLPEDKFCTILSALFLLPLLAFILFFNCMISCKRFCCSLEQNTWSECKWWRATVAREKNSLCS